MGDWLWTLGGLGLLAWLFIDALRWGMSERGDSDGSGNE